MAALICISNFPSLSLLSTKKKAKHQRHRSAEKRVVPVCDRLQVAIKDHSHARFDRGSSLRTATAPSRMWDAFLLELSLRATFFHKTAKNVFVWKTSRMLSQQWAYFQRHCLARCENETFVRNISELSGTLAVRHVKTFTDEYKFADFLKLAEL